jgi:hypothetical protein
VSLGGVDQRQEGSVAYPTSLGGLMKKKVLVLTAALTLAASGPAFAFPESPGAGNPDVNASGKCPPGQNTDTSTGGLKKCP